MSKITRCLIVILAVFGIGVALTLVHNLAPDFFDTEFGSVPPPKEGEALTYRAIEYNLENLTEVQWKSYAQRLIGVRVHWNGVIEDVDDDGIVSLDVGQRSLHGCYLQGVLLAIAKELDKGQSIDFEATIVDIWIDLGLTVVLDGPKIISIK